MTVAVPDHVAWDSTYTELGVQRGYFKQEGLNVRVTHVDDEAALESALSSGRADITVAARFAYVLGAWYEGAPIRII